MVELGFGEKWIEGVYRRELPREKQDRENRGEGRLLGVWARDKMGLSQRDYGELQKSLCCSRGITDLSESRKQSPDVQGSA